MIQPESIAMQEMRRVLQAMETALASGQIEEALQLASRFRDVGMTEHRPEEVALLMKLEVAPRLSRAAEVLTEGRGPARRCSSWSRRPPSNNKAAIWVPRPPPCRISPSATSNSASSTTAISVLREKVLPLRQQLGDGPGQAKTQLDIGLAYANLREASAAGRELIARVRLAAGSGSSNLVKELRDVTRHRSR